MPGSCARDTHGVSCHIRASIQAELSKSYEREAAVPNEETLQLEFLGLQRLYLILWKGKLGIRWTMIMSMTFFAYNL